MFWLSIIIIINYTCKIISLSCKYMYNSKINARNHIILHHQFIIAISVQEFCLANQFLLVLQVTCIVLHSLASLVYMGMEVKMQF